MTTQDFFTNLADWLLADPSHLVTAASGLAALIPTPAPDSVSGKLFKIIDVLALNILHAKEQGQSVPPGGGAVPPSSGALQTAAALAGLSLLLSACSAQSAQKDVFEMRAAYDATILAPLVRYHALPPCGPMVTGACKSPAIDTQLIAADHNAQTALDAAEASVRNNPTLDDQAVLDDAQTAVTAIQTILADNGIH